MRVGVLPGVRILLDSDGDPLNDGHYVDALHAFQRTYFTELLKQHRGNVVEVAKHSGRERTHLYRLFRELGIDVQEFRREPAP